MISKFSVSPKDTRDILVSAILFVLSFPPSPFGFFIYAAFVPQISLYRRHTPAHSFLNGYITGILINCISFYWIAPYSALNAMLIIGLNSFQFAIFGALFSHLDRKHRNIALWLFPFLWTSLEFSRQFGDMAFNWLNIAWTQSYFIRIIQIADLTGYLGIVLWIMLVNFLVWQIIASFPRWKSIVLYTGLILAGFTALLLYGEMALAKESFRQGLQVTCIQPNIDQKLKWRDDFRVENFRRLTAETDSALTKNTGLIIWPETALPYQVRAGKPGLDEVRAYVDSCGRPLLFGSLDSHAENKDTLRYNTAFLIQPDHIAEPLYYHKLKLVPAEEGIPFARHISFLLPDGFKNNYLSAGETVRLMTFSADCRSLEYSASDWRPTSEKSVRQTIKIGAVICYESLFPQIAREYFQNGAQLMTVLTNDAWFGYSVQPYQHLQIAVFRAIENRAAVIQCANSGISGVIDPSGRVYAQSKIFVPQTITAWVPLRQENTIYTRYGDWLAILCFSLVIFSYIYNCIKKQVN